MPLAPLIQMNNGLKIPALGLGTWQAVPGEVERAVKHAIDVGYRHFDTAMLYGNETEIGEAIRSKISDGTVKRKELFITTKLWNTFHEIEHVVPTCKKSLENLGLDYIDLYLIHFPMAQKYIADLDWSRPFDNAIGIDYDYIDTWTGMEECVELGLTKSIGISNFNSKQVERVLQSATIKPVMNQIEVHPMLNQKKLINFCKDRDILITSYCPFGSPARVWKQPNDPVLNLKDAKLAQIGNKYGKTVGQVILRYLVDIGTIPIPKSTNKKRLAENIDIFDFNLTAEEIKLIDTYDCNNRLVNPDEFKQLPHYPFIGVEF